METVAVSETSGVQERDVQIALAKMLRSSWIGPLLVCELIRGKLPEVRAEEVVDVRCEVSVRDSALALSTDSDRETDLVVRFSIMNAAARSTGLLILEVKILAPFGRGQVDDYCRRAHLLRGQADIVACGLIAPQSHLVKPGVERFPCWLTLESVLRLCSEHVRSAPESHRLDLEREITARAVRTAALGPQPLVSLQRQEQFAYYDTFVSEYAPMLRVNPSSGGLKSLDRFIESPLRVGTIQHRLEEGRVGLLFMSRRYPPDSVSSSAALEGLVFENSGSTSTFIGRGETLAGLNMDASFDSQIDILKAGIDAIVWLHDWAARNRTAFDGWAN